MKAVLIDRFGGPDVLRIGEAAIQEPGPGQVLIRVACAGVNPADDKERAGRLAMIPWPPFPFVPGHDAAGVIERVGPGVTEFRPGDRVMSGSDHLAGEWGSYAEFMRVLADHTGPTPKSVSYAEATTLPVAGRTAWQALFAPEKGALKAGQSVLLHGAAGGVGSFAVQFAKAKGLKVAATCRTDNVDYVSSLGADKVIDYRTETIKSALLEWLPGGVDVVVDAVSMGTLPDALDLLKPGGRVVQIATGTDDGDIPAAIAEAQARGFTRVVAICNFDGAPAELKEIADLVDAGQVRIPPLQVFPLEKLGEAQALIATQHVRGKLAVTVAEIG